jgi:deoxyribodipyrimidine photo-lyase
MSNRAKCAAPQRRPAADDELSTETKRLRTEAPFQKKEEEGTRNKKTAVSLFIFRRDFRVTDNRGLLELMKHSTLSVLPVFFFNPAQISPEQNAYFGSACVEFMLQSLADLDSNQLGGRLLIMEGTDESCLERISGAYTVNSVGFNRDITPFAKKRDAALEAWCTKRQIAVVSCADDYTLLQCEGQVLSGSGRPYAVFTPFYNKVLADHVTDIPKATPLDPQMLDRFVGDAKQVLAVHAISPSKMFQLYLPNGPNKLLALAGGRAAALERLSLVPSFKKYQEERDFPSQDRTTKLSPYLKFGCISVRELFWTAADALGRGHGLVRELIWREFYAHILFNNPHLVGSQIDKGVQNMPFNEKYATFKWSWKESHWSAFREGNVGVPLVDAAVRCLNATGWCHNRNRMVIANFAVKVLGVDWRTCERWFATMAVDYDVASNNGGWLWSSGQGADAQPFFRTFNSFRQSERFDADCTFIKKWVPQLAAVAPKDIHAWDVAFKKYPNVTKMYPPGPIVDIKQMTKAVVESFQKFK